MALGRRRRHRQQEMFISPAEVAKAPAHPFYSAVNRVLREAKFDDRVEELARPYYASGIGRPSLPPGVYIRALMVGFFEGIDSERGIAWRAADSLAIREFLGCAITERTPDHSTISNTRRRLPKEFHDHAFVVVLEILATHGLIKGQTLAVDSSTMEANAAMKSLVRRDTGETYNQFLEKLAKASGIETPTVEDLRRMDRKREGKKTSNDDWMNPSDPDAKIARMKDGRTDLAYKPEHIVDLDTGAVLGAEVHPANASDTQTAKATLQAANDAIYAINEVVPEVAPKSADIVGDKGYHSGELLAALDDNGMRAYIAEPARGRRRWTDDKGQKSEEKAREQRLVYNNRDRMRRGRAKGLHRRRGEIVERAFAHVLDTGGLRRTTLRGRENVAKRYVVHVAAFNLSLVMRKIVGRGKPRWAAAASEGVVWLVVAILGFLRAASTRLAACLSWAFAPTDGRSTADRFQAITCGAAALSTGC